MKKNRMMRMASLLLVAVLLTTCTISGTFAKYVTTNDAKDSARVAQFGIVLQADGALYGKSYDGSHKPVVKTTANEANLTVLSDASKVVYVDALPTLTEETYESGKYYVWDGDNYIMEDANSTFVANTKYYVREENVVAPGTKNETGLNFSVNGQAEVKTKLDVTIESEEIFLNGGTYAVMVKAPDVTETSFEQDTYYTENDGVYTLADAFSNAVGENYYTMENVVEVTGTYYPVVYTTEDFTTGKYDNHSLENIAEGYAKKLNGNQDVTAQTVDGRKIYKIKDKEYAANFDYATLGVEKENLKWEWAFEQKDNQDKVIEWIDGADTILGYLMASKEIADDNAEVVKTHDADGNAVTTIKAPTAAAGDQANDYNLETGFSIDITVTQVD